MPISVLQERASIGSFFKFMHPLIKIKSTSSFNLDLKKILTIFLIAFPVESYFFNMVILSQTQVLVKNKDLSLVVIGM